MGRKKKRKSVGRTRRTPESNEILNLIYQRRGSLLYGCIRFFKVSPNATGPVTAVKVSSPFIISETFGDDEVVLGSVVSMIQEVQRLDAEIKTQFRELHSRLSHIQPKTVEQGRHVSAWITLPDNLSEKDDRTYAAFKKRFVGTLVLLSTEARNLFDIGIVPRPNDRRISLFDYQNNACDTVRLRDLLTAFIHHRYLFLDGEFVSDLFPGDPKNSPIKRTFMGYKFNWIEYVQEIKRASLDIKMRHFTGRLRGWLKRLTLTSRYDQIILLVQNLESFTRLLGKKVGDDRYTNILPMLFEAESDRLWRSIESAREPDETVILSVKFSAPTLKVHDRLSEKMFDVSVKCKLKMEGIDGRSLYADKDFRVLERKVKYEELFDIVNEAFGEDPLVS